MIKMIFAVGANGEFGNSANTLPWKHLPEDMKYFLEYTKDCILIMGRNTWNSLPKRKLPNRDCFVIASDPKTVDELPIDSKDKVYLATSLEIAIKNAEALGTGKDICIIGGRRNLELGASIVDEISMSKISNEALNTSNWDIETYYLDALSILCIAEEHGLIDYTSKAVSSDVSVTIVKRGEIQ